MLKIEFRRPDGTEFTALLTRVHIPTQDRWVAISETPDKKCMAPVPSRIERILSATVGYRYTGGGIVGDVRGTPAEARAAFEESLRMVE
jgi:hypothetical protein